MSTAKNGDSILLFMTGDGDENVSISDFGSHIAADNVSDQI